MGRRQQQQQLQHPPSNSSFWILHRGFATIENETSSNNDTTSDKNNDKPVAVDPVERKITKDEALYHAQMKQLKQKLEDEAARYDPRFPDPLLQEPEPSRDKNKLPFEAIYKNSLPPELSDPESQPCPPWQNPRHHNNPEMDRIFAEDFPGGVIPEDKYVSLPPMRPVEGTDDLYAPKNIIEICDEMLQLNMLEMAALHQKIGQEYGFPLDGPLIIGGSGGRGGGGGGGGGSSAAAAAEPAPVEEARKYFDLKLVGYDDKAKIKVIKEVRAIAGLGLKEAKDVVEAMPKVIMKDIQMEQAEEWKKKLEEAGAKVEIV